MPAGLDQRAPVPQPLLDAFAHVPDPRGRRGRVHRLPVVISLVSCAVAAGSKSQAAICEWVADAPQELLERLGARWDGWRQRYKAPDRRTVQRLLCALDPDFLDEATCSFVAEWHAHQRPATGPVGGRVLTALAVDGKVLRGSRSRIFDPVSLIAAFDHDLGVVVAQRQTDGKSNEIPEARRLLDQLMLTDCVITFDALHTQRETARYLLLRGAQYVMTVKSNQPKLLEACRRLLARPTTASTRYFESERGHGTVRERLLTVAVADAIDFPGIKQVAGVHRWTRDLTTNEVLTREYVIVITSLTAQQADPARLAALVRGHWSIENRLHYVRDVAFEEDRSTVTSRNLPRIMATLRNLAIGMIRLAGHTNIAATLRALGRRPEQLPALLHLT
jgi:predicted transposase YbfD/YdcC